MHFDDRLATVLRLPEAGEAMGRIQYAQLVDILGRLPVDARSAAIDAGLDRLATLGRRIPAGERARMLARPLQPLTNARLIAVLAQAEPEVARAAIGQAHLDEGEWLALVPSLPVHARGVLRHRKDLPPAAESLLAQLGIHDRGLPEASASHAPKAQSEAALEYAAAQASAPAPAAEPLRVFAPASNDAADELDLLDLAFDAPPSDVTPPASPPTSLSEWARAHSPLQRHEREDTLREAPHDHGVLLAPSQAGIGAIVRRIEEFRRARETRAPETGAETPQLPLGDAAPGSQRLATAIDFATDAEGRIAWADGPHATSIIGLALASAENVAQQAAFSAAIRRHLPLRGHLLGMTGAPAVCGAWQVDAAPRFDPANGRFTGYAGRLRRPPSPAQPVVARSSEKGDRLREILHELRTPANAIQVAAEIIQQQLYGPAPHEYRALAAAIAGDCAHILAGFEELDRLARLETGALELEAGSCDLAAVLAQTLSRLRAWTQPRGSSFALPLAPSPAQMSVALDRTEAERMVWRLLAALAGSMAPGENLPLTWHEDGGLFVIEITLPALLAAKEPEALFDSPAGEGGQPRVQSSLAAGMFGIGFSLRLATAEAAAAGGALVREGSALRLSLPALTAADAGNSTAAHATF